MALSSETEQEISANALKPIWLLAVWWSGGLILLSFASIALSALVLFLLSFLIGTPLLPFVFRFGLRIYPVIWGIGIFASFRCHHSKTLAASLVVVGCATF